MEAAIATHTPITEFMGMTLHRYKEFRQAITNFFDSREEK